MARMICSLKRKPKNDMTIDTTNTMRNVCAATWFIALSSPRPLYCAMSTVPAMGNPPPMAIMRKLIGNDNDTAATASALRRPTQKVSMTWYIVWSRLEKTMGIDRRTSAFMMDPSVREGLLIGGHCSDTSCD